MKESITHNDIDIDTVVLGRLIYRLPVSALLSPSSINMLLRILRKPFGAIISIAKMAPRMWRSKVLARASPNAKVVKPSQRSIAFGSFLGSYCLEHHQYLSCGYCDKRFFTPIEAVDHGRQHYYACTLCRIQAHFPTLELLEEHCSSTEHVRKSARARANPSPLRISPYSAQDKIARGTKVKRGEILPDGVKRQVGLTEEQQSMVQGVKAALVGKALDVLSEQELCEIASKVGSQSACSKRMSLIRRIG